MSNFGSKKRQCAIFIPYKKQGDALYVYLQKRSVTMKTLPNYFGFWGGGMEADETPEMGLVREVKEELGIDLDMAQAQLFNRYEFLRSIKFVYTYAVPEGWEQTIVIGEGDYGEWFLLDQVFLIPNLIFEDKVILNDLERAWYKKPIR